MAWLVRDDEVLAAAEVATTRKARRRGLRGRSELEGVLVLRPCRAVHTFGVRFPLDVAFCDESGRVLHTQTIPPRRLSRIVWNAAMVVEAGAGRFYRWRVEVGDVLEVRE